MMNYLTPTRLPNERCNEVAVAQDQHDKQIKSRNNFAKLSFGVMAAFTLHAAYNYLAHKKEFGATLVVATAVVATINALVYYIVNRNSPAARGYTGPRLAWVEVVLGIQGRLAVPKKPDAPPAPGTQEGANLQGANSPLPTPAKPAAPQATSEEPKGDTLSSASESKPDVSTPPTGTTPPLPQPAASTTPTGPTPELPNSAATIPPVIPTPQQNASKDAKEESAVKQQPDQPDLSADPQPQTPAGAAPGTPTSSAKSDDLIDWNPTDSGAKALALGASAPGTPIKSSESSAASSAPATPSTTDSAASSAVSTPNSALASPAAPVLKAAANTASNEAPNSFWGFLAK